MSANTYALARIPIVNRPNGYYLRWWFGGWHYWQFLPGDLTVITEGEKYRTRSVRKITVNSGQLTYDQVSAIRTILNSTEVYLYTNFGWVMVRLDGGNSKVYDNKHGGYELTVSLTIGSRLPGVTGFSPAINLPVIPPSVNWCETIIGNQIWMCKAYDAPYPGSKVYDNLEGNRAIFGGLYTWAQVMAPGFVPEGWRVPTLGDWLELIDYVGSLSDAGGKLKAIGTDYWASPNVDASDDYGFAARSTGELLNNTIFADLYQNGNFWTSEESDADFPPTKAVAIQMSYQYGSVTLLDLLKTTFTGVRLIKNAIPSSIIRIGFIGGNNPVAGVYRSTNGGLAWQISDTFSVDNTQLTDWIPFACSGDWWAGRGYQYEAIVYKYSESKKYTFNGTSGGVTALYVGDVIIAATEGPGSAVAKLYQYDPGLDSFVLLSSTGMSDGNISALSFSGTYLIVISTSGIYAIGHPTTVLRQAGNFTAMLDMGDGTIFAGADGGHVWRSDDYGLTWSDMGAKTPDGILSIALIGSGRIAFFSYYDIYITDDEFATVTKVYDNSITYGPIIKISETECMTFNGVDGILIAALKSTDNGETFTAIAIDDLNDFQGVITCAQISS